MHAIERPIRTLKGQIELLRVHKSCGDQLYGRMDLHKAVLGRQRANFL